MPLPENIIILFYWTAPKAASFVFSGRKSADVDSPAELVLELAGLDGGDGI